MSLGCLKVGKYLAHFASVEVEGTATCNCLNEGQTLADGRMARLATEQSKLNTASRSERMDGSKLYPPATKIISRRPLNFGILP